MHLMLRASSLSCRLVETIVNKQDGTFAYIKGGRDRLDSGYHKYFAHDEHGEAKEWIVRMHNRLDGQHITKEEVTHVKSKEISESERASGKLRRAKKGRKR